MYVVRSEANLAPPFRTVCFRFAAYSVSPVAPKLLAHGNEPREIVRKICDLDEALDGDRLTVAVNVAIRHPETKKEVVLYRIDDE